MGTAPARVYNWLRGEVSAMAIPSQRRTSHPVARTAVIPLTAVERALWRLQMPVLDRHTVAEYKKRSKRGMLWRAMRWQLLALAALVAFECLGREWSHAAVVGAAAVVLAALFGWLVSSSDLQWRTALFSVYQTGNAVPPHVSAAANALVGSGISPSRIGVEYLKDDPILFVEQPLAEDSVHPAELKRYDLIVW